MIRGFADRDTERLARGQRVRRFVNIEHAALRKLAMLDAAHVIDDLRAPPGNRLEALKGDSAGQYPIRVNDQYRICFTWQKDGPHDVELTDDH